MRERPPRSSQGFGQPYGRASAPILWRQPDSPTRLSHEEPRPTLEGRPSLGGYISRLANVTRDAFTNATSVLIGGNESQARSPSRSPRRSLHAPSPRGSPRRLPPTPASLPPVASLPQSQSPRLSAVGLSTVHPDPAPAAGSDYADEATPPGQVVYNFYYNVDAALTTATCAPSAVPLPAHGAQRLPQRYGSRVVGWSPRVVQADAVPQRAPVAAAKRPRDAAPAPLRRAVPPRPTDTHHAVSAPRRAVEKKELPDANTNPLGAATDKKDAPANPFAPKTDEAKTDAPAAPTAFSFGAPAAEAPKPAAAAAPAAGGFGGFRKDGPPVEIDDNGFASNAGSEDDEEEKPAAAAAAANPFSFGAPAAPTAAANPFAAKDSEKLPAANPFGAATDKKDAPANPFAPKTDEAKTDAPAAPTAFSFGAPAAEAPKPAAAPIATPDPAANPFMAGAAATTPATPFTFGATPVNATAPAAGAPTAGFGPSKGPPQKKRRY